MILRPPIVLVVLAGTGLIGLIATRLVREYWPRMALIGFLIGTLIYSGLGAAAPDVPGYYIVYYFVVTISFVFGYCTIYLLSVGFSRKVGNTLLGALSKTESARKWNIVIIAYILLQFFPLVYPEIKLTELLTPKAPNLIVAWQEQFREQEVNYILKLAEYVRILIFPFFLIALYRYRKRIVVLVFLLFLPIYAQHVIFGYVGRSPIGMALLLVFVSQWAMYPKSRTKIAIVGMIVLLLGLAGSYYYVIIRMGGRPENLNVIRASIRIITYEISFPTKVGVPLIESGQQADLLAFVRWIVTLPVPKIFTGEIPGARSNYDISEIILRVGTGERGWYVILPGLVAESVYIYGTRFFWIHGIFLGLLASISIRLVEKTPQLLFLQAYLLILFSYILNRAGIAALLPYIINYFILFYLFLIILVMTRPKERAAVKFRPRFP